MSAEALVEDMVPIARRLIGAVQKVRKREAVERVLATIPGERTPEENALLVLLAAMVEPDVNPEQLLAWTETLADEDGPQAREQRRLESLGVDSAAARLLATQAAAQNPGLAGMSPPVRAEKAAVRDDTRRRDRERKQVQRAAAREETVLDRMLQATQAGRRTA